MMLAARDLEQAMADLGERAVQFRFLIRDRSLGAPLLGGECHDASARLWWTKLPRLNTTRRRYHQPFTGSFITFHGDSAAF
jgi:hypothetical protein